MSHNMEPTDEWRMCGLVPYNISPIQQGIQYGHAVQEYNNMMMCPKFPAKIKDAFEHWRLRDKTFIILNGGTTNTRMIDDETFAGSMNNHLVALSEIGVTFSVFYEPDLGDQLTAVVFLVPDKVYNRDKYPDFDQWLRGMVADSETYVGLMLEQYKGEVSDKFTEYYDEWAETVGGQQNVELREFLKQFKLAR